MTQVAIHQDEALPLDAALLYVFTGVAAFGALLAAAYTPDPLFRFHAYIFLIAFAGVGADTHAVEQACGRAGTKIA